MIITPENMEAKNDAVEDEFPFQWDDFRLPY